MSTPSPYPGFKLSPDGQSWIPDTPPVPPAPPAPPPGFPPPPPPNPHAMGQGLPPSAPPPGYPPASPPGYPPAAAPVFAPNGQPGRYKTRRVRFSYLFVNPRDSKGKQRVTLLFPKSDPQVYAELCAKRDEAIRFKVKGGEMPQYYRDPIKDGDTYLNPTNRKPLGEECRGFWVINAVAHGATNVEIFDQYGNQIIAPGAVRSGDWGRASITFYYSTKDNNLGVNVSLNSLIYTDRGEPLSSAGISAEDEFAGEFLQAPQGYVPPGHGYQAPALPAPNQTSTPGFIPQAAPGGFAPPPGAPGSVPTAAATPMQWSEAQRAWIPASAPQPAAPPAPPPYTPPPPPAPSGPAPSGPPPGAPLSPDGKFWWNAAANTWVPL